jgi:hypothetical protein
MKRPTVIIEESFVAYGNLWLLLLQLGLEEVKEGELHIRSARLGLSALEVY